MSVKTLTEQVAAQAKTANAGPAQLQAADPSRGFSTPYYMAKTNSGDDAGAVWVGESGKVMLVDPKTGQVLASGVGQQGAQDIVSMANRLSQDQGRKAQWQILGEQDGQLRTMAADRYDPKHNLLKKIIQVAAPILGTLIPIPGVGTMLGNMIGASLGGFGGSLATGGSFKDSLLSGGISGLGAGLGGLAGKALGGLGGLTGSAGLDSLLGSAGGDLLGGAAGGALGQGAGTLLSELVVPGVVGGLGGALGSAAGAGLGSFGGSLLSGGSATQGGWSDTIGGGAGQDQIGQNVNDDTLSPTVDEVTITAPQPATIATTPGVGGLFDFSGLQGPPNTGPLSQPGQGQEGLNGNDLMDLLQGVLQQQPGLPVPMLQWFLAQQQGNGQIPNTSAPGNPTTATGNPGGTTSGLSPFSTSGTGGTHGRTAPTGPVTRGVGFGGQSGIGVGDPGVDITGSLAPDIYPWSTGGL